MKTDRDMTVGTIGRLAGVTVRTLHHYDEIGLVVPSGRTRSGYRLYGPEDVQRLQEVLFFKELGFGLDQIRDIVTKPEYERLAALSRQRAMLEHRADRLRQMIDAIDTTIDAEKQGKSMSKEDMLEVFGDFDPSDYEDEARERWGNTDAYRQSAERTARYGKQDWQQIQREAEEINQAFLVLMAADDAADSREAMQVAERHREHISKWFYDCGPEIHAGLGQMYVTDQRFTKNIDKAGEGLAQFMSEAMAANAANAGT